MAKDPFILMSLQEDKAKKLTQAIGNDTARQILNYLSSIKDASESEISERLKVPISTIHYNLKNLMAAKLVEVDEFHYSKKGKEVNHYKLANKIIIIAPKETSNLKEKLKSLLPVGIVCLGTAWVINSLNRAKGLAPEMAMAVANNRMAYDMAEIASDEVLAKTAAEPLMAASQAYGGGIVQSEPNIALWFIAGALLATLTIMIVDYIRNRKK